MKHANLSIFVPHVGCPNQCIFCDQHAISGQGELPDANTVTSLCERMLPQMLEKGFESEIAFFGGSFTAIDRDYMESLLKAAAPFVGEGKFTGIRISTRPDAIDDEVLILLKGYGVTAIELGVQSMNDRALQRNRRGHTAQDTIRASGFIHAHGFSLGHQLMVGMYGDTPEDLNRTVKASLALKPDVVRIYPTVVLKNTLLAEHYERGDYQPMTLEETVETCAKLLETFEGQGIPVIRLGLHDSESLQKNTLAGAYHPALRQLCESRRFRQRVLAYLSLHNPSAGAYHLTVHPRERSVAVGQHKENLCYFAQLGYHFEITEDVLLTSGQFILDKK